MKNLEEREQCAGEGKWRPNEISETRSARNIIRKI